MALAKGQRIEIRVGDTIEYGHVHKVAAAGVSLLTDSWMVTKPVAAARVIPSLQPVPDGAPGSRVWKKGDRIEFVTRERLVHATVLSANLLDVKAMADGGEVEYGVPARGLRPSSKVLPVPAPSVMDDWAVRAYKTARGLSEETEAFSAELTYGGRVVIRARNDGRGGCNMYHGERAHLDRLHRDAQAWLAEADVEHLAEAADLWLDWHARLRPYAVDAREHLRRFDREVGQAIHTPFEP